MVRREIHRLYHPGGAPAYAGTGYRAEGRFLPHGQGREYYEDGTLRYEGGFLHGARHGAGKYYDPNGTLRYEGEFRGGEMRGRGRSYTAAGVLAYEGAFRLRGSGGHPRNLCV